jgi:hypothetical protein
MICNFFDFNCITRTVVFFLFNERFCIYNTPIIERKIRYIIFKYFLQIVKD